MALLTLVSREDNVGIFQQVRAEHVCEGMVFLIECEDRAVRSSFIELLEIATAIRG